MTCLLRNWAPLVAVSDAALIDCMVFYAERMKILVEPTGCLSLAAAMQMRGQLANKRVGIIVSGGNVDVQRFSSLIAGR